MKHVDIYADGACSGNPGPGGYGVVLIYKNSETGKVTKKELSGGTYSTTNNRMELMGVIIALQSLKESCEVTLYTDSQYIVNAITQGWAKKWKANNWMRTSKDKALNSDLWETVLDLLEKHKVEFKWVKGHASNENNNRCDKLAVSAALTYKRS